MKKITSFLFSMFFTGLLLMIFAISVGYATFIENDYGTITAKVLVYNSWWFEVLLAVIVVNLAGSILVNKLITKRKWTIFLFHLAFIFMIIGAGITRYFGFEGFMHIREGELANHVLSEATYISIMATENGQSVYSEKEVKFSGYTANRYSQKLRLNGKNIQIKNIQFIPSAAETVVEDYNGEPIITLLAVTKEMQKYDLVLKKGKSKTLGNTSFGFESKGFGTSVNFTESGGAVFMTVTDSLAVIEMTGETQQVLPPGTQIVVTPQKIYQTGGISFVNMQYYPKANVQLRYSPREDGEPTNDAFIAGIKVGNETDNLIIYGQKGVVGEPALTKVGGVDFSLTYGSKNFTLPFSIKLEDFQLDRYPGSNSPSSYASNVVLSDKSNGVVKPFRIYMNKILKYRGYRFFQSSYDPDEMGTILSVNHDKAGTSVTYFGYLIMAIGMVLSLFNKNSRFTKLARASAKIRAERKKLLAAIFIGMILSLPSVAQTGKNVERIDKHHVASFSQLLIQNNAGRIEPVGTLASEVLRKVSKKTSVDGIPASEVFLSMSINPELWKSKPLIKISNPDLRKLLGTNESLVPFNFMVTSPENGGYKLNDLVQKSYEKKTAERNKLDKEIINVDERINILMSVFSGNFLAIFPVPGHSNNKWASISNLAAFDSANAVLTETILTNYFSSVDEAIHSGNWSKPDSYLQVLKNNQRKLGAGIVPSEFKTKTEVFYNNVNIFGKLSKLYLLVGFILLIFEFLTIFRPQMKIGKLKKAGLIVAVLLFLVHSFGLTIRWYISGHAPWSNGYESMIFIGWGTCLAGLIFSNRSKITLSLTLILAGFALLVAGMSWMSPEITNLVPVLKSYWLIVHVAIITASYGFLGICALLGLLNLVLMIFRTEKNVAKINLTIKELTLITQMALIIGLYMLTIGSFIGGVWANESWGRYWGWDPKETWALVTILVYAFISHMHKIPGFKGDFALNVAALVGFSSVLMTYFGVNYYLSGLHSYAQGEAASIPKGVYLAIFIVVVLIIAAWFSERTYKSKNELNPEEGIENS